jgi:hypothetical protein
MSFNDYHTYDIGNKDRLYRLRIDSEQTQGFQWLCQQQQYIEQRLCVAIRLEENQVFHKKTHLPTSFLRTNSRVAENTSSYFHTSKRRADSLDIFLDCKSDTFKTIREKLFFTHLLFKRKKLFGRALCARLSSLTRKKYIYLRRRKQREAVVSILKNERKYVVPLRGSFLPDSQRLLWQLHILRG